MSDNLWAGSTSTLTYIPRTSAGATYDTAPTLGSVVLKDAAGATVTLAATPSWNATLHGWVLNVSATECPTTADGKVWEVVWAWTDADGNKTTHRDALICSVLTGNTVALCTRQQVKDRLGIKSTDAAKDARIDTLISAVLAVVKARYRREFSPQATATRTFKVDERFVDLAPYDLRSATEVKLHTEADDDEVTLTAGTDYALGPVGADARTGTYTFLLLSEALHLHNDFFHLFGYTQLEITGAWGIWGDFSEVPADINEAAIECVCAWMSRNASDTGGIGNDPREAAPAVTTWDIPFSAHRKFSAYADQSAGVY